MTRARALGATAAMLLTLSFGAAVTSASSPEPTAAYPTATSAPEDTEGTISLPGLSGQSENFQFALKESATSLIDSDAVMEAGTRALEGTGLKLAVAVDQEPVSVESVGQLIRGMLLFGPIDALSEDWVENGKARGYVAKDWVVIGIILPASGQGKAQVGVDLGRNVEVKSGVEGSALTAAGLTNFSDGHATAGVIETIESVVSGVQREADYAKYALIVLAVLAVLGGGIAIIQLTRQRRRTWEAARRKDTQAAIGHINAYARKIEQLGYQPLQPTGTGPASDTLAWLAAHGPQLVSEARQAASIHDAQDLGAVPRVRVRADAATLRELFAVLDELASWQRPAAQESSLNRVRAHHRQQLAAIPELLEQDTDGELRNTDELRELMVVHTDGLELLQQHSAPLHGRPAAELLDEHWILRQELDTQLRRALDALGDDEQLARQLRQGDPKDPDIYEKLSRLRSSHSPVGSA